MSKIIAFPTPSAGLCRNLEAKMHDPLQLHLDRYQWHFGRDAFWFFVTEKRRLPDVKEAQGLAALLGHRIKAANGKYYGVKRKERQAASKERSDLVPWSKLQSSLACIAELFSNTLLLDGKPNNNICERIANQLDVVLPILALLGTRLGQDGGTPRTTSQPDQGVRCDKR